MKAFMPMFAESLSRFPCSSLLIAIFTGLSISGCDSTNSEVETASGINTGVFVDSPVGNINYRTATQSGTTSASGEFSYRNGEEVTFFIGGVELPPAPARSTVTPLDLFKTEEVDDPRVLNVSRLLLSLDEDGDPDNGITIGDQAKEAAQGMSVDFSSPTFETDVVNLVANSGSPTTALVTAIDAQRHLQGQLDVLIPDDDDDGVPNTEDAFPNDPDETLDSDNDGVGDNSDHDPFDPAISTVCDDPALAGTVDDCTPPVADASIAEMVGVPFAEVELDSSMSFDPDGSAITIDWQIVSQPNNAGATITKDVLERDIFTAGEFEGEYVIRLTVTDPAGLSATDEVTFTVDKGLLSAINIFATSNMALLLIVWAKNRRRKISKREEGGDL